VAEIVIEVEPRPAAGSAVSRRLRREGKVPSVIYWAGKHCIPVSVVERAFVRIATSALPSQVFTLKSSDQELDGKIALVREIQQDSVSGRVVHIDFLELEKGIAIDVKVPLHFIGDAVGVKQQGGFLNIPEREIHLRCAPENIPSYIEVNVSALEINDRITAVEVALPVNVELAEEEDRTIVNVVASRAARLAEEEEAAAAGAAEAAATPAPAAAPASKK
jgi:large subunit ribosomal protein L25